ncbi:DUF6234 family protein [Streptomyces asoensis]|uniref:DUF6234 family protein n=1 Tax=Streptomyces asoensis TaxID=249586 RepID=UPI0037AE2F1A
MTDISSPPRRGRPWSRRTRPGVDLAFAIPLFVLEAGWFALDGVYGFGLQVWAAQGDRASVDAAGLAHLGRVRTLLVAVLVLAVVAAVFRARWTVAAHLVVALLVGGALNAERHEYEGHGSAAPACVPHGADCRPVTVVP